MNPTDRQIRNFNHKYLCSVKKTDCWEWQASLKSGYGQFGDGTTAWSGFAHKFSYMINNDDYDRTLYVRHSCHNRKCVNPGHLTQGTNAENMQDNVDRGDTKVVTQKGGMHFNAIMTEAIVVELRKQRRAGVTGKTLAKRYGFAESTVGRALTGKTWGHVPGAITDPLYQRGEAHRKSHAG